MKMMLATLAFIAAVLSASAEENDQGQNQQDDAGRNEVNSLVLIFTGGSEFPN